MNQKGNRILVAVPCIDSVHPDLCQALLQMDQDPRTVIAFSSGRPTDANRNTIAKFITDGSYDWLIMIDSDNPPIKEPQALCDLGLDIVCCPTPIRTGGEFRWNVFLETKGDEDIITMHSQPRGSGLQEIDSCGMGCIVIKRDVLLSLDAPFLDDFNMHGTRSVGHDIAFCRRAKQAGFTVWAHWDHLCHHHKGGINLLELMPDGPFQQARTNSQVQPVA